MGVNEKANNDQQLISYITLRKVIGILGVAFPIALLIGSIAMFDCKEIQSSISAYYHTGMRNLFVGVLCAIALFLFTYTGYDSKDSTAGNIGCFFALGVAFFPTSYSGPINSCVTEIVPDGIVSAVHFASAAGLFLILAYFSICRFTKTKKEPESCWKRLNPSKNIERPEGKKLIRNRIYIGCGLTIIACILLIAVYKFVRETSIGAFLAALKPIFWLETFALWAFGVSWLTKGKSLFPDSA